MSERATKWKWARAALLLALGLLIPRCVRANGTVYYVAPGGSDANPGTLRQPWRTIAMANDALRAGDTVYIRGGVYDERIVPGHSGRPGEQIRYANYPGEEVIVRGTSDEKSIVEIDSRSHIVIDGLTIQHKEEDLWEDFYGLVVVRGRGAAHNVVKNCKLTRDGDPLALIRQNQRERGIQVKEGATHTTVEGNYLQGMNMGVHLASGQSHGTVRNNTIINSGQDSIYVSNDGLEQYNLIEGNLCDGSAVSDCIQFSNNTHLSLTDRRIVTDNRYHVVRNNIFMNCAENALDLKAVQYAVIEGNIMYGMIGSSSGPLEGWNRNAMSPVRTAGSTTTRDVIVRNNVIYDNPAGISAYDGYRVYHNTVVGNNRDYTGPDSDFDLERKPRFWGIMHREGDVAIQNNLVVGHNTVEMVLRPDHGSGYINNNMYYNPQGTYFTDFAEVRDWPRLRFGAWRSHLKGKASFSGNDAFSILAKPRFVNAPVDPVGDHEQFDFGLQAGSRAIDAGGPLTRAAGSGSGRRIVVEDASYFFDGYGLVDGDLIQVGQNKPVRITSIDYDTNMIALDREISWDRWDWVSLPYNGLAPDIGAYECDGECSLPPPRMDRRQAR